MSYEASFDISDPDQFEKLLQWIEWQAKKAELQGRRNPFVNEDARTDQ